MVTCWEKAVLLALVGDVYCIFVIFPCGILDQVWYLIVSFPDLCRLSYFESARSENDRPYFKNSDIANENCCHGNIRHDT